MKKILSSLILVSFLTLPVICLAQITIGIGGAPSTPTVDIMYLLNSITNWLFAILLVVAAMFIIIAGYFFITAMGDPDKVVKARQVVFYALIGGLVAVAAKGLVKLVETIAAPPIISI